MANPIDLATLFREQIGGRRNIIHNGAFIVDQRATPVTFTNGGSTKTVDRWRASSGSLDEATVVMQQSTTVPSGAGFGNSLQFNVTGTESALDTGENFWFGHFIEGQNLQQLAYGTSSAKKITLSFWVRSHVAGDFGVLFYRSGATRSYTASYTVNATNTWEYKTITIDGDTDTDPSSAIPNDNSAGMGLYFSLAMGSNYYGAGAAAWSGHNSNQFTISTQTNILSATGSFYITGVQLEVGDTATPFEHRSYAEELELCKRYYQRWDADAINYRFAPAHVKGTAAAEALFQLRPEMRAGPTSLETTGTASDYKVYSNGIDTCTGVALNANSNKYTGIVEATASGLATGDAGQLISANSNAYVAFSAEL